MHTAETASPAHGCIVLPTNAPPMFSQGDVYFDPDDYLIGILLRMSESDGAVRIDLPGVGDLLIDPKLRRYSSSEVGASFFKAESRCFRQHIVPYDEVVWHHPERDLDELLWIAAYHASEGRLPKGCSKFDVVRLAYWPNLSRLPSDDTTLRLCALFCKRPRAINVARSHLRIDETDIYRFYSAALFSRAISVFSRFQSEQDVACDSSTQTPIPDRRSSYDSLLKLLWKKLSLGR